MAAHRFTENDIQRWISDGLITREQADALLHDLATHHTGESGLDLTTLLYYGGGLLVLIAYGIFLGLQWEGMNEAARIAIAAASLVFFAVVSRVLLRSERYRLPGELLQVVAVAIVPLLTFAVLDAAGWWPHDPGYPSAEFETDLTWARMALAGTTLIAAGLAFTQSRSPFVLAAVAVSFASLVLDVSIQFETERLNYVWETPQSIVIALVGAGSIAAGVAVRGEGERDYSLWLYLMGLAGLAVGLGSRALNEDAEPLWGTVWMVTAFGILALSLVLQERMFAAAGLAAVFLYLAKLVFDVFQSANAALILVVLGLLVLGIGMLYQRYNERLFGGPAGRGAST